MAQTYDAIASYSFPSAANNFTFTSIPTTYTDLVLVANVTYQSLGGSTGYPLIRVGNGTVDTGTSYSYRFIYSDTGSVVTNGSGANSNFYNTIMNQTGTTQSTGIFHFQNYANTSIWKTIINRMNNGAITITGTSATACLWRSTSAINTIQFFDYSNYNFAAGSTLSLFGIKAA